MQIVSDMFENELWPKKEKNQGYGGEGDKEDTTEKEKNVFSFSKWLYTAELYYLFFLTKTKS